MWYGRELSSTMLPFLSLSRDFFPNNYPPSANNFPHHFTNLMIIGVSPILKNLFCKKTPRPNIQAQSPVYIWSDIVLELQFLNQRFVGVNIPIAQTFTIAHESPLNLRNSRDRENLSMFIHGKILLYWVTRLYKLIWRVIRVNLERVKKEKKPGKKRGLFQGES